LNCLQLAYMGNAANRRATDPTNPLRQDVDGFQNLVSLRVEKKMEVAKMDTRQIQWKFFVFV